MGEARVKQDWADNRIANAEHELSAGNTAGALAWFRSALRFRPHDLLTVSPALQRAWDEQDTPPEVD